MFILYLIGAVASTVALYWLLTETDFQVHKKMKPKLFWGMFIPVFCILFFVAPERWWVSIPAGLFGGAYLGLLWAHGIPRKIQNSKDGIGRW